MIDYFAQLNGGTPEPEETQAPAEPVVETPAPEIPEPEVVQEPIPEPVVDEATVEVEDAATHVETVTTTPPVEPIPSVETGSVPDTLQVDNVPVNVYRGLFLVLRSTDPYATDLKPSNFIGVQFLEMDQSIRADVPLERLNERGYPLKEESIYYMGDHNPNVRNEVPVATALHLAAGTFANNRYQFLELRLAYTNLKKNGTEADVRTLELRLKKFLETVDTESVHYSHPFFKNTQALTDLNPTGLVSPKVEITKEDKDSFDNWFSLIWFK